MRWPKDTVFSRNLGQGEGINLGSGLDSDPRGNLSKDLGIDLGSDLRTDQESNLGEGLRRG